MAEYIEKKAALADLNKTYDAMSAFHPQFYAGYQFAVNRLRVFPTADVAPVRRGQWTPFHSAAAGDIWYCSACEVGGDWRSDFRPNCGARMDLGGADNG